MFVLQDVRDDFTPQEELYLDMYLSKCKMKQDRDHHKILFLLHDKDTSDYIKYDEFYMVRKRKWMISLGSLACLWSKVFAYVLLAS